MSNPIISFQDFGFQYDAQAEPTLHHINLDIYPGEKVLIAGASGSGKSTIGNCINGLIPFAYPGESTGKLLVDGKEAKQVGIFELSHTVGTVLQDTDGQFIGLNVAEDIAFALENDCVPQEKLFDIVDEVAKLVGMQDFLEQEPHELSGGQKQRVSLAGILVDDVKVLLFDEPLANLDPASGKHTIELIDEVQKRTGAAVIIIEHRVEDVLWKSVDRIVLMEEGKILTDMRPAEILAEDWLMPHGIREPLYLTALKYAGVGITAEMKPEHQDSLCLSTEQQMQVRNWADVQLEKYDVSAGNVAKSNPEMANFKEASVEPVAKVPLLEVKNLCFSYDENRPILQDVSFTIHKGEMVSIVGQNGAGKSTLAKLICGFEQPADGRICFEGRDIAGDTIKERAAKIGYVMQNPNQMLSKPMIWDEVELALMQTDMSAEERKQRVEETLKVCGLYPFRKWPVSALSYGQKKRVTIASILVQRPQLIILDEPTAGQDYRHYTEIMEFLVELNKQGYAILMITHDMHLMLEYTPRAICFSSGKLLADNSAAYVLTHPEIVREANLKETSLYGLSLQCGVENPQTFVERFIEYEREMRAERNGECCG